jgi:hypothetical protein
MRGSSRSERTGCGDARKIIAGLLPEKRMHKFVIGIIALALAGCGVETATTAATGAAIKKQEIEDGKKTMTQVESKVGAAVEQMQQRAQSDAEK